MSRIFTDGAEMGDILFWNDQGTVTVTSTNPASGSYCYSLYGTVSSTYKNINPISEMYFRTRIRWGMPAYQSQYGLFPGILSGSTILTYLSFNASSYLTAYIGGTTVTAGSPLASHNQLLNAEQWYLLEIYFKLADAGGRFVVKLGGVIVIDYTGDTKPDANTTFNRIFLMSNSDYPPHRYTYFDDLAMNDTSGVTDNSWCGSGRVERLFPSSDGDTLQWTPSSGSVHYTLVDEVPTDGDTTFVFTTGSGMQDMYGLSPYTSTNKNVKRIWAEARAKDFSSSGKYIKIGVKTGGSIMLSSASSILQSEPYGRVIGDVYTAGSSGSAWTSEALNSLQFVIESED